MDEIALLQAQLQAIQLQPETERLSEQNMVELVSKAKALGLLSVCHTSDGTAYITMEEIEKEIVDVLQENQGRVSLLQLSADLGVTLDLVQHSVHSLVQSNKDLQEILGELLHRTYLDSVAESINDELQANGLLSVSAMCSNVSLPVSVVLEVVRSRQGKLIHGTLDMERGMLCTDWYRARVEAWVRGALRGVLRPVTLKQIAKDLGLHPDLCYDMARSLSQSDCLPGTVVGENGAATYLPHVYHVTQAKWADSFLNSNGYIGTEQIKAVHMDGVEGLERMCTGRPGHMLESCFLSQPLADTVEAMLEDALLSVGYCDITTLFAFHVTSRDLELLIGCLPCLEPANGCLVLKQRYAVSESCLGRCRRLVYRRLLERGEKEGGEVQNSSRGDGGAQKKKRGRKADKKIQNQTNADCFGERKLESFLPCKEISAAISAGIPDLQGTSLVEAIAAALQQPIAAQYKLLVHSSQPIAGLSRKEALSQSESHLSTVLATASLFLKGLENMEGVACQEQLGRHYVLTFGLDLLSALFHAVALTSLIPVSANDCADTAGRQRLLAALQLCPHDLEPMTAAEKALANENPRGLVRTVEAAAHHFQLAIRKPGRGQEGTVAANYRISLEQGLAQTSQPATAVHLAVMLLLQRQTDYPISAPATCVPALVQHLESLMATNQYHVLRECHDLVMSAVGRESADDPDLLAVPERLRSLALS